MAMKWKSTNGECPIKSFAIISTGTVDVHPEHVYGTRKPQLLWIFTSRRWLPLPIIVCVIQHADGLILFDTGQNRAVVTDPAYFPGGLTGFVFRRLFRFHIRSEDTLSRQLEAVGYSAGDVRKAVISHLHFDHVGGISEIPQADLLVSFDEWESLNRPHPERRGIFRREIDIPGAKWQRVVLEPTDDPSLAPFESSFDLMGDGSLMLLPTPGHTTGSLSMLVRRGTASPLLLIGDLAYAVELLQQRQVPGAGEERQLLDTYAKVLALKARIPGLIIVASHDPQASGRLRVVTPHSARATFTARGGRG
jgi:glyoxylase-like metal-dependent hydrolase (beta-lactamase superfamily II)